MQSEIKIEKSEYAKIVLPFIGQTVVYKYTIDNGFMSVELINYGASVVAINVPDSSGNMKNVVLSYDDIVGYLNLKNPYIGATIGRYGHRIAEGSLVLDNQKYCLSKNDGPHTYHGGVQGFDKKIWDSRIEDDAVIMTYRSYDLEQGFPGDLCVSARFILSFENQLIIIYKAVPSNMATPINMLNQLYFNLSGDFDNDILDHEVKVCSEYIALMGEEGLIPTGETEELAGTAYDLRKYITIKSLISPKEEILIGEGIEDSKQEVKNESPPEPPEDTIESNSKQQQSETVVTCNLQRGLYYCIEGMGVRLHAMLKHNESGRAVEIYSDQPCLLLSVCPEHEEDNHSIKKWGSNAGILLQTGNFPDAVHHDKFPSPWIHPNKTYQHAIVYQFRVTQQKGIDVEEVKRSPEELDRITRLRCISVKTKEID